jgi:hypothetical protein
LVISRAQKNIPTMHARSMAKSYLLKKRATRGRAWPLYTVAALQQSVPRSTTTYLNGLHVYLPASLKRRKKQCTESNALPGHRVVQKRLKPLHRGTKRKMHGLCTARTPHGANGSKAVQYRTTKQCTTVHFTRMYGAKATQGSATPCNKAVHGWQDTARCKSDSRQCTAVQKGKYTGDALLGHHNEKGSKAVQHGATKQCMAVHFHDTVWCKNDPTKQCTAVHFHDTMRCKSDSRQCNTVQQSSARFQDTARCKSDPRQCNAVQQSNARMVHW